MARRIAAPATEAGHTSAQTLVLGGRGHREPRRAVELDDPARVRVGRILEDRFSLTAVLGRGGMGVVYDGFDHVLERPVVVKVISPRASEARAPERLVREARLAARVQHPSIVTVFHLGLLDAAEPYIVMERVDGPDLESLFLAQGPFDLETVVAVADPVAEALEALHAGGIVHRDVKPANVLVLGGRLERPRVKLIDFGLAILDEATSARLTKVGHVLGTPEYIAPECARGAPATPASDTYALATSLFELLTGDIPFEGVGVDLMIAKTRATPRKVKDLCAEPWAHDVDDVLSAGMHREPTRRPSPTRLLEALRHVAAPVPLTHRRVRAPRGLPETRTSLPVAGPLETAPPGAPAKVLRNVVVKG